MTGGDEWPSGRRDDGGKKGGWKAKGSKPDWHSDKDNGSKGKGKDKGKSETRCCCDCGGQEHIGFNCPYKWPYSMDEEDDQTSSWKSEPKGEKAEELASLETLDEDQIEDEQASSGLNHLVSRNAGGAQWTWKKITVVVDSCASVNVMPRSMFPEMGTRQTERSKSGKGFKGPGGGNIKNYGQQIMSVRTL